MKIQNRISEAIDLVKSICVLMLAAVIAGNSIGCSHSGGNAAQPTPTPAPLATMTKEKYDKINLGMTSDEVKGIVGGEGELISESGDKSSPDYTTTYQYQAEGNPNGSAKITFRSNKAISKSESNL